MMCLVKLVVFLNSVNKGNTKLMKIKGFTVIAL